MLNHSKNLVNHSNVFRRRYERKNYGVDVAFVFKDRLYQGRIKDICIGGAFIQTPDAHHLWEGDLITTSIPFTNGRSHVKRSGRIIWKNSSGFAMDFS